jgi:hypothetical protein
MIVYKSTKQGFLTDVFGHDIEEVVLDAYRTATRRRPSPGEIRSWASSLVYMAKALNDEGIPGDAGVAVEYEIRQTQKRIDFLLSGVSSAGASTVIVVELKQWSSSTKTSMDGVVKTRFHDGMKETTHPSYQAWSYVALLNGFNEAVHSGDIDIGACAYLHNCPADSELADPFYGHHIKNAPLFFKGDAERGRLRAFIARHIEKGDGAEAIVRIENGKLRPSKALADSVVGMLRGNQEFVLVDDQKIAFENARAIAGSTPRDTKQVVIIQGGPGTGRSVIAINLLVDMLRRGVMCQYVSKNAAPRAVYSNRLAGTRSRAEIAGLFAGPWGFVDAPNDCFDVLVVDEAHRLNEKSGLYANLGENQVKELIEAARTSIFLVDDRQLVTFKDIGTTTEIKKWAHAHGAVVREMTLASQYRCGGSEGYLSWIDLVLGIDSDTRPVNNIVPEGMDFRVFDSPDEMHSEIERLNRRRNSARVVAGYCWDWKSRRVPTAFDITIEGHPYRKRWNLTQDGSLWLVANASVDQVGCIHTCQGLEVDHIGVIIGPDLKYRGGRVIACPEARSKHDKSLSGFKKLLKDRPVDARNRADSIIRNTYRTLMTRGMKSCFVYCVDQPLAIHIRSKWRQVSAGSTASPTVPLSKVAETKPGYRAPRKRD